jgi:hypothetical protein
VCLPSALFDNIVAILPYTLSIGYEPGLPATIAFLSVKKTQRVTAQTEIPERVAIPEGDTERVII